MEYGQQHKKQCVNDPRLTESKKWRQQFKSDIITEFSLQNAKFQKMRNEVIERKKFFFVIDLADITNPDIKSVIRNQCNRAVAIIKEVLIEDIQRSTPYRKILDKFDRFFYSQCIATKIHDNEEIHR